MILQILTKVEVLFFILALGILARARKVITDDALDDLTRVVLDVTLPFLFIYILATRCMGGGTASLWLCPVIAVAINLTGFLVGTVAAKALRLPPKRRDTFALVTSFQNSGFLAIPIAFALFGEDGVLYVVMFSIGFNILYWTFGVWLISRSSEIKIGTAPIFLDITTIKNGRCPYFLKNLLNPAIFALALGLILGISCVNLPKFFLEASRMVGDTTVPLAMLVVGGMLAAKGFKRETTPREVLAIVLCKLIIVPAVFLVFLKSFKDIPPLVRSITMLQAALPTASTSPLFAKRFGGDHELASDAVFFTTLFSVVTMPVFMSLI